MSTIKRINGEYRVESLTNPLYNPDNPDNPSKNPELFGMTFKTSRFVVDGDLKVLGDTVIEDITERNIIDPVVYLNSQKDEETGDELITEIPIDNDTGLRIAGMAINRGLEWVSNPPPGENPGFIGPERTDVILRYNDGTDTNNNDGFWEATDDGVNFYPLDSAGNFKLIDDTDPHLGGDLIVNDFKIRGEYIFNQTIGDLVLEADNDLIIKADTNATGTGNIKIGSPISIEIQSTDAPNVINHNTLYAKDIGSGGTGVYVSNSEGTDELVSRRKAIIFGLIF